MIDLQAKFRAWDNIKKSYELTDFTIFDFNRFNLYQQEQLVRFEIEEWTGLLDRNDKLVYEGDLFKFDNDENFIFRVWKVVGGFGSNVYVPKWQNDITKTYPFPLLSLADEQTASWFKGSCYVIGNIKQNPEYLDLEYLKGLINKNSDIFNLNLNKF